MLDEWLTALQDRHRAALTTPEFLKAVRALSARYVERRSELATRSPLDSAGKRAAFAAFYTPLHFLTVREIVRALSSRAAPRRIVDLGCGTGAASAAWALASAGDAAHAPDDTAPDSGQRVLLSGIDSNAWAVDECRWNWRRLSVIGDVRRGDLVRAAENLHSTLGRLKPAPTDGRDGKRTDVGAGVSRTDVGGNATDVGAGFSRPDRVGIVAAWSVNELGAAARDVLLPTLLRLIERRAAVLIVEPLAGSAAPWWDSWAAAFEAAGGRRDTWKLGVSLPEPLRIVSDNAGFHRETLTAKTLWHDFPT